MLRTHIAARMVVSVPTRRLPLAAWSVWLLAALILAAVALPAEAQEFMATGSYIGNGLDTRAITGVGFAPDLVIIKTEHSKEAIIKTANMPDGLSKKMLFEVILAAGEMEIESLVHLCCARVATLIKGKSPDEIRAVLSPES